MPPGLNRLQEEIDSLKTLDMGDSGYALSRIARTAERLVDEPALTGSGTGSPELDNLCTRLGQLNLQRLGNRQPADTASRDAFRVYVVTRVLLSGGHMRVIESFIRACPDQHHLVLSTELLGRSDEAGVRRLQQLGKVKVHRSTDRSPAAKLDWLQERLLSVRSSHVFLFSHHQDSVAVSAIVPEMSLNAYYYHHCDYQFSLGVYAEGLRHIDPHPMGYHECAQRGVQNNIYIPLVVEDRGVIDRPFLNGGRLRTCTVAKYNKVEVSYTCDYFDVITSLMAATGGTHVHIGRLTPMGRAKLRYLMLKKRIPRERLQYLPAVSSLSQYLLENDVDLYIASFPYGGGMTLLEVMSVGAPVILHRHLYSRVLSSIDLAYPGVPDWRKPRELLDFCKAVSVDDLRMMAQRGRQHYETHYRPGQLRRLLAREITGVDPVEPLQDYAVDQVECADWLADQQRLTRVLSRRLYRFIARLRKMLR